MSWAVAMASPFLPVPPRRASLVRLVQRVAPIAGGVGVLGYVIVARLPTDVNLIWTGTIAQAVWQLVLLLVAWEGFGVGEAGAVLGISDQAARARYSRARTRLRRTLGGSSDD